jgi:hypothetical protein
MRFERGFFGDFLGLRGCRDYGRRAVRRAVFWLSMWFV